MPQPSWMDVDPIQLSLAGNIPHFERNDPTFTPIGRSVGTGMGTHLTLDTETGTGSILGWGIDKGIGTGTGIIKHFQDQGTSTDNGTISSNIDNIDITNFTGPLAPISESGLLQPILESESESSLVGLPFKPRTFDDNLVNHSHLHLHHLDHGEDHRHIDLPHLDFDRRSGVLLPRG